MNKSMREVLFALSAATYSITFLMMATSTFGPETIPLTWVLYALMPSLYLPMSSLAFLLFVAALILWGREAISISRL